MSDKPKRKWNSNKWISPRYGYKGLIGIFWYVIGSAIYVSTPDKSIWVAIPMVILTFYVPLELMRVDAIEEAQIDKDLLEVARNLDK